MNLQSIKDKLADAPAWLRGLGDPRRGVHLVVAAAVLGVILWGGRTPPTPTPDKVATVTPAAAAATPAKASGDTGAGAGTAAPAVKVDAAPPAPPAPTIAPVPMAPTFRDARPLAEPATPVPVAAAAAAPSAPSFHDARALATPSFRDARPVTAPSFRDSRPVDTAAVSNPAPPSPSNAVAPGLPTLVAIAPPSLRVEGAPCAAPEVSGVPLGGGQMQLRIAAACHPNEAVQISYGGAELIRRLGAFGALDFVLDCFAGVASPVEIRFADGTRRSLPVAAHDLDKVSKIAVIWRAPVNLDLHVFEYASRLGQPGHVWTKSPSSLNAARLNGQAERRGRGYISHSDDEQTLGDKLEVYTFLHNDEQAAGTIGLALDHETRGAVATGAACGAGALAEVDFQVAILPRNGLVSRQAGVLTRVACGVRLGPEVRFNASALPGLRIRR